MALSFLNVQANSGVAWAAVVNVAGLASGRQCSGQDVKLAALGTALANASAGGADEFYFAALSIPAAGSTTLDLTNLTDLLGQTGTSFARLKYWRIRLLGVSELAPDNMTGGTACSSVAVGNAASNAFGFGWSSLVNTQQVNNASEWEYLDGSAAGVTVDATHKNVKIANNDATYAATVLVMLVGGTN